MSFEDHGIDPNRRTFGYAHPVLLLGIFIFILPFFNTFTNWNLPKWMGPLGIIIILIGGVCSILGNL
jgi:protein-S-isoprenylcysteine O-methyltransferase Ste14